MVRHARRALGAGGLAVHPGNGRQAGGEGMKFLETLDGRQRNQRSPF